MVYHIFRCFLLCLVLTRFNNLIKLTASVTGFSLVQVESETNKNKDYYTVSKCLMFWLFLKSTFWVITACTPILLLLYIIIILVYNLFVRLIRFFFKFKFLFHEHIPDTGVWKYCVVCLENTNLIIHDYTLICLEYICALISLNRDDTD